MKSFITIILILFSAAISAQSFFSSDGIRYRIIIEADESSSTGTVAVTAQDDMPYQGSVTIPNAVTQYEGNYVDKYKVVAIDASAFKGCVALVSVSLPMSLERIGDRAFEGCICLSSIEFPAIGNVSSLGEGVFAESGLETISLPEGIQMIPNRAFHNCKSLKTVKLPNSLRRIGLSAFMGCASLEAIDLPEGLIEIQSGCFTWSGISNIKIPHNVMVIPDAAFVGCINLKSVELSTKTVKLGASAFGYCMKLSSINKPESLRSIDPHAFDCCPLIPDYYKEYDSTSGSMSAEVLQSVYDNQYKTVFGSYPKK